MQANIGRYVFQCTAPDCQELQIVPATGRRDAKTFLLDETPWTLRVGLDESQLLCPECSLEGTVEGEGASHYGLLVCRSGRWFTILDEDERHDFMAEFDSEEDARAFATSNPLCQDAQVVLLLDFANREVVATL